MGGIPVIIKSSGGFPVRQVTARAPVMTVATNGKGVRITLSSRGAPFIIQGSGVVTSYRITEAGDRRVTEAGDPRVVE